MTGRIARFGIFDHGDSGLSIAAILLCSERVIGMPNEAAGESPQKVPNRAIENPESRDSASYASAGPLQGGLEPTPSGDLTLWISVVYTGSATVPIHFYEVFYIIK